MMKYRFTPREQDVAELLMKGCRQIDIARRLAIEVSTVRVHERNIMQKMGTQSRFETALKLCLTQVIADAIA